MARWLCSRGAVRVCSRDPSYSTSKKKLNYLSPHIVTSLIQTGFNLFAHFCGGGALGLWSSNIRIWELCPRCWNSNTIKSSNMKNFNSETREKGPCYYQTSTDSIVRVLVSFLNEFSSKSCPVSVRSFKNAVRCQSVRPDKDGTGFSGFSVSVSAESEKLWQTYSM